MREAASFLSVHRLRWRALQLAFVAMLGVSAMLHDAGVGRAAADEVSIVYNFGPIGKLDKSFNEAAYRGVIMAEKAFGIEITEYEPQNAEEQLAALRTAVASGGLTIAVGWGLQGDVAKIAPDHPESKIAAIDFPLDEPNVQSILFREEEGAYLVGLLAGMVTTTNVVGFVGGRDIPVIHRFRRGYQAGVRQASPAIQVLWKMTGTTHEAFADPVGGMRIAEQMIKEEADVLFAAAGATGLGVYQAAKDFGVLAIGVDSNQNYLFPGTMLTSMLKRVDKAVEIAVEQFVLGRWRPGVQTLGVREGGIDYAVDQFNQVLINDEMQRRLSEVREAIISNRLDVQKSMENY